MQSISPLDTAYNRLDEAHRAWHTALDGYHRIEDFRAGVNTAIQAFQNLVYALEYQRKQGVVPGIDTWFDAYKERMKRDLILKELHSGRVLVVHQEDLKLKSTATARTKGWLDFEKMAFTFDPTKDSYTIATGFYDSYAKHLPVAEEVKERLIFEFERRWVYEKLPDHELLETLAHSYNFFYEMLKDATQKFSLLEKNNYTTGDYCSGEFNDRGVLKCMVITPQERCLSFGFKNGNILKLQSRSSFRNEADLKRVHARYGDFWKSEEITSLLDNIFSEEYPFDQMKLFIQVALGNLKRDKHLVPVSFIFKENDTVPVIVSYTFGNQEQKLLAMDKVASEVIKNNARFVLTIAELWLYNIKERKHRVPTEGDTKNTKEMFQASCISAEKMKIVSIPFQKSIFGKIIFSKAEVSDFLTTENHGNYILLPLIEALKKVKAH